MTIQLMSGLDGVYLPDPVIGDRRLANYNATVNRNRNNEPTLYSSLETYETYYEFQGLTEAIVTDLVPFLDTYAGKIIDLVWEAASSGILMDPVITVVTIRDECSHTFSFSFLEVS